MDVGHIPLFFGGIAATVAAVWILANRPRTKSRQWTEEMPCRTPPTKKRKRRSREDSALGETAHQRRYSKETLKPFGGHYLSPYSKAPREDGSVNWRARHDKATAAVNASWAGHRKWAEASVRICSKTGHISSIELSAAGWDTEVESSSSNDNNNKPKLEMSRKHAVRFLYVQDYGRMPEEKWANWYGRLSLPGVICRRLNISPNSLAEVKSIMKEIYAEEEAGNGTYDASRAKGGGRKAEIQDFTPQADVVYNALECGMSVGNSLVLLNGWRRHPQRGLGPISYHALRRFIDNSTAIVRTKRGTTKDGSKDEESDLCVGRTVFSAQLIRQLVKGERIENGGPGYVEEEDGPWEQAELERPIFLGALGSYDESSKECRCGHASRHETRIWRDADGKPTNEVSGGVLPDPMPVQTHKHEKTAGGLFGAICSRVGNERDGELTAETTKPLSYTTASGIQFVLGYDEFEKDIEKVEKEVRKRKRAENGMPLTSGVGKGFKDQFPGTDATNKKLKDGTREPNWRREVRKKIETRSKNPKRCVTDFMDHIIAQMKAKFDGTWYEDKWMVYHDALSAWTATDSMEYLNSTGYADRFITIVGTNNDLVCKRYRNSKPGNSPEFSRGCDSFGFPKHKLAMEFNCSLASVYPLGDPRRIFNQGNPMELWHLMETTWTEVAPDSESLVQDFSAFLPVARIVNENEGRLVPDLALRSGRRHLSKKHAGEKRKSNIKSRDTIATQMMPKVHPSLEEAVEILYKPRDP